MTQIQRENFLDLLKMIVLKGNFCHKKIEHILCNPHELPLMNHDKCTNSCPSYLDTIFDCMMPTVVEGLSRFLAETFINNESGSLSPYALISKLIQHKEVGRFVYKRPRNPKAPAGKHAAVTLLKLIASGLIEFQFDDKSYECSFSLGVTLISPAYLEDANWSQRFMCE